MDWICIAVGVLVLLAFGVVGGIATYWYIDQ